MQCDCGCGVVLRLSEVGAYVALDLDACPTGTAPSPASLRMYLSVANVPILAELLLALYEQMDKRALV